MSSFANHVLHFVHKTKVLVRERQDMSTVRDGAGAPPVCTNATAVHRRRVSTLDFLGGVKSTTFASGLEAIRMHAHEEILTIMERQALLHYEALNEASVPASLKYLDYRVRFADPYLPLPLKWHAGTLEVSTSIRNVKNCQKKHFYRLVSSVRGFAIVQPKPE